MNQWEYIFIKASWDKMWRVEYVNNSPLRAELFSYVNAMGGDGWEMVDAAYIYYTNQYGSTTEETYRVVMKRAKKS